MDSFRVPHTEMEQVDGGLSLWSQSVVSVFLPNVDSPGGQEWFRRRPGGMHEVLLEQTGRRLHPHTHICEFQLL